MYAIWDALTTQFLCAGQFMSSAFIEFLIDFLALDYSEWLNTIYIHFIVHVKVFYQTLILVLEIYIML